MNGNARYSSSGLAPWIWAYRFWAHIRQQPAFRAKELESDLSRSDLERLGQDFKANPEAAADVQIAKWRTE